MRRPLAWADPHIAVPRTHPRGIAHLELVDDAEHALEHNRLRLAAVHLEVEVHTLAARAGAGDLAGVGEGLVQGVLDIVTIDRQRSGEDDFDEIRLPSPQE